MEENQVNCRFGWGEKRRVYRIVAPKGALNREKEYYSVGNYAFEIDRNYELRSVLGEGAFAIVCAATNRETKEQVAIKKLQQGEHRVPSWSMTAREVALHRQIHHPFVVRVKDVMKASGSRDPFGDVYVVLEPGGQDLSKLIRSHGPVGEDDCKLYINQLLRVLKYLHSGRVVHMDVKASNVLVNEHGRIKLCDFGHARRMPAEGFGAASGAGSPFYAAPETLLGPKYTAAVDIWSLGCIFAKLLGSGAHLFNRDTRSEHLRQIAEVIPIPDADDLDFLEDSTSRRRVASLPARQTSLRQEYPVAHPDAVDLLEKMLVFAPPNRITAAEALGHPYMQDITVDVLAQKLNLTPSEVAALNDDRPLEMKFDIEEYLKTGTDSQESAELCERLLFNQATWEPTPPPSSSQQHLP